MLRLKCDYCGSEDVTYLVVLDNEIQVLCEDCFKELCYMYGEMNLTYYSFNFNKYGDIVMYEQDFYLFIEGVKAIIDHLKNTYQSLLKECKGQ